MVSIKTALNHKYAFWALLSLPAIPMLAGLNSGGSDAVHSLLHPTGEFAARFMIVAMMITPLAMLFKNRQWPRWLLRRRRYLGVAAFSYAALHTALYLIDTGLIAFSFAEFSNLYIWTGWIAFLIFLPLAITSTDGWVRKLGKNWKTLQRFIYAAAVLALVHWAALHEWGGIGPALVHFGPLAALETYRITKNFRRRKMAVA